MKISFLIFILSFAILHADDLTLRDGTVYRAYRVLSHDDGYITILYSDGGGKIPLSKLPDALQKQYGYDPVKADFAVKTTTEIDKQQALAVAQAQTAAANAKAKKLEEVPVATPGSPITTSASRAPGNAKISPEQIAALQAQIDDLNSDIAFMQEQEAKLFDDHQHLRADGGSMSTGAYAGKIRDEQQQVQELRQEIASNR